MEDDLGSTCPPWSPSYKTSCEQCGFMYRRDGEAWRLEYFVLKGSTLFFLGRVDESVPTAAITLRGAIVNTKGEGEKGRQRFTVTAPSHHEYKTGKSFRQRTFFLECQSEACEVWVKRLQEQAQSTMSPLPRRTGDGPAPPVLPRRSSSAVSAAAQAASTLTQLAPPRPGPSQKRSDRPTDSGYSSLGTAAAMPPAGQARAQASPGRGGGAGADSYANLSRPLAVYGRRASGGGGSASQRTVAPRGGGGGNLSRHAFEAQQLAESTRAETLQLQGLPAGGVSSSDGPGLQVAAGASACPVLLPPAPTAPPQPNRGQKLSKALGVIVSDVIRGGKLSGREGVITLMSRVQKIATVCRTMVEVANTSAADMRGGFPVFFARAEADAELLGSSLKQFVGRAIAIKEHLEKYPEDLGSGALLHFGEFAAFKSAAEALGKCAAQLFKALDLFQLLRTALAALQAAAADPKLRACVSEALSALQTLVADATESRQAAYVNSTKAVMAGAKTLLKLLLAASDLLGPCLDGGCAFWDFVPISSLRASIIEHMSHLLDATKKCVGVWPTESSVMAMLEAAYDLTLAELRLLALTQTMPILWDQLFFTQPSTPGHRLSIASASSVGSASDSPDSAYFQMNEALNISASIAVTITTCTRELSKLTSRELDVTTDAGKEAAGVALSLVGQIQSEIEALELVGLDAETLESLGNCRERFNFVSNELSFAMSSATGRWPPPDALVRVHQQAVAMREVAETLATTVAAIVSQQKRAVQEIQLQRRRLRHERRQREELERLSAAEAAGDSGSGAQGALATSGATAPLDTSLQDIDAAAIALPPEPEPDDLVFHDADESASGLRNVKGGSLQRLIQRMTYHEHPETHMVRAFLLTYRSFTDPETLLGMLIDRYNLKPPPSYTEVQVEAFEAQRVTPVRLRVFNVLKRWINSGTQEFRTSETLRNQLAVFLKVMALTLPRASQNLSKLLAKRLAEAPELGTAAATSNTSVDMSLAPPPILPQILPPAPLVNLLTLDPLEVARQMTVLDWKFFSAIQPRECLDQAWNRNDGIAAPNLRAMITRANSISHWVTTTVLGKPDLDQRSFALAWFVHLIDHLIQLHNYHGAIAVFTSLNNSSLHRLKRTKAHLPAELRTKLGEQEEMLQPTSNYKAYRLRLHSIAPPCIPFLGMYLTDLTMIEEGNKNLIKGTELINFDKRRKIATVIEELQQYQQQGYVLQPISILQDHFDLVHAPVDESSQAVKAREEEHYNQSLELEPRGEAQVASPSATKKSFISRRAATVKNRLTKRPSKTRRATLED